MTGLRPPLRRSGRLLPKLAFVCAALALLLQSLAPPGYMAGSIEGGWPVVLCPEGLPPGFLGHDAHHHHDDSDGTGDLSLDGYCPLGSVLDASLAMLLPMLQAASQTVDEPVTRDFTPLLLTPRPTHPSRAPPQYV
jgi:hypothetical protein